MISSSAVGRPRVWPDRALCSPNTDTGGEDTRAAHSFAWVRSRGASQQLAVFWNITRATVASLVPSLSQDHLEMLDFPSSAKQADPISTTANPRALFLATSVVPQREMP